MYRDMLNLTVETSNDTDEVWIQQEGGPDEDDAIVIVGVEQIDALIKWLQEAKDEIQNASK